MKALMFEAMERRGMHIDRRLFTGLEISPSRHGFLVRRSHGAETLQQEFEVVLNCVGRGPAVEGIGLEHVQGLQLDRSSLIKGQQRGVPELTGNERVFAIGDALKGTARNNPSADYGGKRVARMIRDLIDVARGQPVQPRDQLSKGMALRVGQDLPEQPITDVEGVFGKYAGFDYRSMPYTVFALPELSGAGLSEEQAASLYGRDAIRCVTLKKSPLKQDFANTVAGLSLRDASYFKVVSLRESDRIVGLHYLGERGEDLMYGLHLALEKQLTRQDLARAFVIHPSTSEAFVEAAVLDASAESENC